MQLLSIKTSRFPNRVYLKFSNGLFLPLFIDDFVLHRFKSGQEISDDCLSEILNLSLSYLLYEYSLRQIALSPKSAVKLVQKLNTYFHRCLQKYHLGSYSLNPKELIAESINKLQSRSLLNDQEYIKYFIKKNKNKSKKEITFLLNQEGLSPNFEDDQILESDIEKIKSVLIKKKVVIKNLADYDYKNKIYGYLYRKGFSLSDIKNAIDEMADSR